jgi:hypothetical protein
MMHSYSSKNNNKSSSNNNDNRNSELAEINFLWTTACYKTDRKQKISHGWIKRNGDPK